MTGTFCIVDLAGFAALTEAHGDETAAQLARSFAATVRETLPPGGRLLKTMGDAVLVVTPDSAGALRFVGDLWTTLAARGFLILRAGLHHGDALELDGDVFGGTVNLTARIAALATADQVLASGPVATVARELGLLVTDLGPVALKNVRNPVPLYAIELRREDSGAAVVDPVCRMRVDYEHAAGRLRYEGREYFFCSLECASRFTEDPAAFAR